MPMAAGCLGPDVDRIIALALREDLGSGDVTSKALIPARRKGSARFLCKARGIAAGLPVAGRVFEMIDKRALFEPLAKDGDNVAPGDLLARVSGRLRTILAGERTALNFLTRLSGIATLASRFAAAAPDGPAVFDTRKTTPGLRKLEKYAVMIGGCRNHRFGLYDMALVKENHIRASGLSSMAEIVRKCREAGPKGMKVEVEVENLDQFRHALESGADIIMLDDMDEGEVAEAVRLRGSRGIEIEVSGGVTLDRISRGFPRGVDRVSSGFLTHSAPALDISMKLD